MYTFDHVYNSGRHIWLTGIAPFYINKSSVHGVVGRSCVGLHFDSGND